MLQERSGKLRSYVRNNRLGNTMKMYHLLEIDIGILMWAIISLHWNKVSGLG
jgi:hypothetical protein